MSSWDSENLQPFVELRKALIAIGDKAWSGFADGAPWAKIGDRVKYAKYANMRICDPDNEKIELLLLNDNDIFAVVEPK